MNAVIMWFTSRSPYNQELVLALLTATQQIPKFQFTRRSSLPLPSHFHPLALYNFSAIFLLKREREREKEGKKNSKRTKKKTTHERISSILSEVKISEIVYVYLVALLMSQTYPTNSCRCLQCCTIIQPIRKVATKEKFENEICRFQTIDKCVQQNFLLLSNSLLKQKKKVEFFFCSLLHCVCTDNDRYLEFNHCN